MNSLFIPIIGAISSGKSTFLNGFLGIDVLETGLTTTTKFVCLIKNSNKNLFYHVIPKRENNSVIFIKEGEETKDEIQIKKRIEKINENLIKKKGTKDDIFYIFETHIKNIKNDSFLENCYFMDIPGLNENNSDYIENIFSLITINDILFQIIIFDSTNICSDDILFILKSLKNKNVMKNKNNLFILNKIDQCTKNGEENIINEFKKYFYETFEDEKKLINNSIKLNLAENYFIPFNSILYNAETKLENEFTSLLIFEIFDYLENYKIKYSSFFEFMKKKLEFINKYIKIEVDKELKKLDENDKQIIINGVEFIQIMFKNNSNLQLGLNLNKKNCEKEIKKLYVIQKIKKYEIFHTKMYEKLDEIINNIKINNLDNLDCPPNIEGLIIKDQKRIEYELYTENTNEKSYLSLINNFNKLLIKIVFENKKNYNDIYSKEFSIEDLNKVGDFFKLFDTIDKLLEGFKELFMNKKLKINKINNNIKLSIIPINILGEYNLYIPKEIPDKISVIKDLDNFLIQTFKEIDPNNELKTFKSNLQTLRENILGRKIRISFIGNISVGKSTVLNCIIGTNLLPSKDSECTYRGVIIRYKNENEFKLFRTKLITRGIGFDQYYFFEDEKNPFCEGEINIKNYLRNKNNDKKIDDNDAYVVITGKLKIFDFIQLDDNIINKIEFIDLPGNNREINVFNKKGYYKKILKFSNICIYINDPKSLETRYNIEKISYQYQEDKDKVFPTLKQEFIKTCIFLVNKSDYINSEKEKEKIKNIFIENIKKIEPNLQENEKNINLSFFSGKSFIYYLDIQKNFIELFEKNPIELVKNYYKNWYKDYGDNNFKDFISDKILSPIEENFDLDLDEEIKIPDDISDKLEEAFKIVVNNKIKNFEKNEIISKLYSLYYQIKNKNFNETIYSSLFFNKLKEVIIFSENLQNKNLNFSMAEFISQTDLLFEKKINDQNEENLKQLNYIQDNVIPRLNSFFCQVKNEIKEIIENGKFRCLDLINNEINNAKEKLKEADNKIESATEILEEKIGKIIKEMNEKKENKLNNLNSQIQNIINETINKFQEIDKNDIKIENTSSLKNTIIAGVFTSIFTNLISLCGVNYIVASTYISTLIPYGVSSATITSTYTGIGTILGSAAGGISATGIGIGIGVGIAVGMGAVFLYKYLTKYKEYKATLEKVKDQIEDKFRDELSKFEDDINMNHDSLINKLSTQVELRKKNINTIDMNKWKDLKNIYAKLKLNVQNIINNNQ